MVVGCSVIALVLTQTFTELSSDKAAVNCTSLRNHSPSVFSTLCQPSAVLSSRYAMVTLASGAVLSMVKVRVVVSPSLPFASV